MVERLLQIPRLNHVVNQGISIMTNHRNVCQGSSAGLNFNTLTEVAVTGRRVWVFIDNVIDTRRGIFGCLRIEALKVFLSW